MVVSQILFLHNTGHPQIFKSRNPRSVTPVRRARNFFIPLRSSLRQNEDKAPLRKTDENSQLSRSTDALPSIPTSQFAFILTACVTAVAGGPVLATWSAFFLVLGRITDTPFWLWSLSASLCAGITDLFTLNWAGFSWDSGFTPYLVFGAGVLSAAVLDFDHVFGTTSPNDSNYVSHKHELEEQSGQKTGTQFSKWDAAFEKEREDPKNE